VYTQISPSSDHTFSLGQKLGKALECGSVIVLTGSLGSGKTCLTKGLVNGINGYPADRVTSPAFSLVNEYIVNEDPKIVYHKDFYRLDFASAEDIEMLREYLTNSNAITIIEWGERFIQALTHDYIAVSLEFLEDDESRKISLMTHGNASNLDSRLGGLLIS